MTFDQDLLPISNESIYGLVHYIMYRYYSGNYGNDNQRINQLIEQCCVAWNETHIAMIDPPLLLEMVKAAFARDSAELERIKATPR